MLRHRAFPVAHFAIFETEKTKLIARNYHCSKLSKLKRHHILCWCPIRLCVYSCVFFLSLSVDGMPSFHDGSRSQSNRGSTQLHTNAVLEFEERLEAIKVGLSHGVDCFVWEGEALSCRGGGGGGSACKELVAH